MTSGDPEPRDVQAPRYPVTLWIMIGVLLWGGLLALGAIWAGGNHAAWRGLIIFTCTLAFLGFWWAALQFRRRHEH